MPLLKHPLTPGERAVAIALVAFAVFAAAMLFGACDVRYAARFNEAGQVEHFRAKGSPADRARAARLIEADVANDATVPVHAHAPTPARPVCRHAETHVVCAHTHPELYARADTLR